MPSRVFEITIPVIKLPKTYALDRTANGINHTLTHTHTLTLTHTPRHMYVGRRIHTYVHTSRARQTKR